MDSWGLSGNKVATMSLKFYSFVFPPPPPFSVASGAEKKKKKKWKEMKMKFLGVLFLHVWPAM